MMLCVYGVVRATHPGVEAQGVQGSATSTVRSGDLGAIVSAVGGELLARRRDVEAHFTVLEEALRGGDVLPFSFGAVVEDDAALCALLDGSAPRFRELLARVGGRVQMTLKVLRDDDAAVRVVVGADPRLRRMAAERQGSTLWTEKVALGERVAAAVEQLSRADVDVVTRRLSAVADALEVGAGTPPAVASIALLVHPDRLADVDKVVASLHDELGSRLSFEYAGPMPAYSFVR
jgi:hypothetical protein